MNFMRIKIPASTKPAQARIQAGALPARAPSKRKRKKEKREREREREREEERRGEARRKRYVQ